MSKLIIESIDDSSNMGLSSAADLNKDFQRRVAAHFYVCPVLSNKAYETFIDAGVRRRATHVVFGVWAYGQETDTGLVKRMFGRLFGELCAMWPAGSTVIWRRFPEVTEYYEEEVCTACGHSSRDKPRVKITFRLGSPEARRVIPKCVEGEPLPQFLGEQE